MINFKCLKCGYCCIIPAITIIKPEHVDSNIVVEKTLDFVEKIMMKPPMSPCPHLKFNNENGESLCTECHKKEHPRLRFDIYYIKMEIGQEHIIKFNVNTSVIRMKNNQGDSYFYMKGVKFLKGLPKDAEKRNKTFEAAILFRDNFIKENPSLFT